MEKITRKQHYVQRKYLSLWTDNLSTEGMANFEIDGQPEKTINIKAVLFENDFYKIPVLNDDEIAVCEKIFRYLPNVNFENIDSYINNFKITQDIDCNYDKSIKKHFEQTLIQLGEDFQKCAENMMNDGIRTKIQNCDDSFLDDKCEKQLFFNYLFMQYMRTPKILKQIIKNTKTILNRYPNRKVDGKKIWSVTHNVIASSMANFMVSQNIRIKFIVSENEELITCDCPVVRLSPVNDTIDTFYYPFSPKIGLVIGGYQMSWTQLLKSDEIIFYNNLIRNNAERIIVLKYKKK